MLGGWSPREKVSWLGYRTLGAPQLNQLDNGRALGPPGKTGLLGSEAVTTNFQEEYPNSIKPVSIKPKPQPVPEPALPCVVPRPAGGGNGSRLLAGHPNTGSSCLWPFLSIKERQEMLALGFGKVFA